MSFEVGEIDHIVVAGEVIAHYVVFDVAPVAYRYHHLPLFVHQIHRGYGVEAMLMDCLPVGLDGVALALIGGVALHDGAAHGVDELAYQRGFEIVGIAGFAGADLHGHAVAVGRPAKRFIHLHEGFGEMSRVMYTFD